jgi:phage terminase small subunit
MTLLRGDIQDEEDCTMPKIKPDNQENFAQHYALHHDGAKAYRHAYQTEGQKDSTVYGKASQLLHTPKVAQRISELREKISTVADKKFSVDAEFVLEQLYNAVTLDVADILRDDGRVKPISEWPKPWRMCIQGLDVVELVGKDAEPAAIIKKLKLPDRSKYLDMLGKHVNIGAWKESELGKDVGRGIGELLAEVRAERSR